MNQTHIIRTHSLVRFSLGLLLLASIVGCASSNANRGNFSGPVQDFKEWTGEVDTSPGTLSFDMQIKKGSSASVRLVENSTFAVPPISVLFTSTDCALGHDVNIQYFVDKKTSYFKHFHELFKSDSSSRITIFWDAKGHFALKMGDETIEVQSAFSFSYVEFASPSAGIILTNYNFEKTTYQSERK